MLIRVIASVFILFLLQNIVRMIIFLHKEKPIGLTIVMTIVRA